MIEIRKFLKNKNITIIKFAKDLNLSRNTTMLYISLYEKGETIRKEKYKYIFDFLFTDISNFDFNYFCITHSNIKQKLDRLEKLDQLEKLDKYLDFTDGALMSGFDYKEQQIVAMPLEEYNKLLKKNKALKIMKLKGEEIYIPAIQKSSDITSYLLRVGAQSTTITPEEFNVLKEAL